MVSTRQQGPPQGQRPESPFHHTPDFPRQNQRLSLNSGTVGGPGHLSMLLLWDKLKMTLAHPTDPAFWKGVPRYPPAICGQPAKVLPVPSLVTEDFLHRDFVPLLPLVSLPPPQRQPHSATLQLLPVTSQPPPPFRSHSSKAPGLWPRTDQHREPWRFLETQAGVWAMKDSSFRCHN